MGRGTSKRLARQSKGVTNAEEPLEGVIERAQAQKHVTVTAKHYSGPIPPAEVAEGYERLVPGATARILAMAENQQAHRIAQESAVNQSNIISQQAADDRLARGQWMAYSLALVGLGLSAALIFLGHPLVGTGFAGATLVGLVGAFLIDRSKAK